MTLTTRNGGNTVTHGKPQPPREELPIQFVGREPRWYETFPIVRVSLAISATLLCLPHVVRFVLYAINR